MPVYLGIFLLMALSGRTQTPRRVRLLLQAWTMFLIVFAGTRENVGCDFQSYLLRFQDFHYWTLEQAIKNAEFVQRAKEIAITQERNRLAHDLHDAVNQTLFTASIMAEALPKVWERDPEQARQGLDEIRQLTRSALSEMRTLLMELHPQRITEKTLGDLLDHLTRSVSNRLRIPIDLSIENDTILPADIQVAFYRVAQEVFNNISKHSLANQVWVVVDARPFQALLIIRDDGQGFDPQQAPQIGHLGLGIMKERAAQIGAQLEIRSQLNQGTEVSLTWQSEKMSVR